MQEVTQHLYDVTPQMIGKIYGMTMLGVSIILATAGVGFSVGCGLICDKTIEGLVRVPESRPTLMADMFIFTGFMGNFPFIILAFAMWFLFANPFEGAFHSVIKSLSTFGILGAGG